MNLFVNPEERRLRAFWRLLIQFAIFFIGGLLFGLFLSLSALLIMLVSGLIPAAVATDPNALATLINQKIVNFPFLQAVDALFTLVLMLFTYWLAARYLDHRPLSDYGFHFGAHWWRDLAFGLLLGSLLMALIFAAELTAGWLKVDGTFASHDVGLPFWPGLIQAGVLYLCVGIYEEMLFRGYQLRNLAEGFNLPAVGPRASLWTAYLLSSLIFGLLHLGNPHATAASTLNLIAAGLFLGLGYVLTGELAISIGLHISWNFFQGNVFGFPVSGGVPPVSFLAIRQAGPNLWTGGAFGPEAGLVGLLALLLGGLLVLWWVRRTHGDLRLQIRLAQYRPPAAGRAAAGNAQTDPLPTLRLKQGGSPSA